MQRESFAILVRDSRRVGYGLLTSSLVSFKLENKTTGSVVQLCKTLSGSLDSSYGIVPGLKDSDFSFNDHIGVETKSENSRKVKEKLQKQIFDRKEAARQRDLLIAQQKKAAFERDDSDDYDSFQDQGPGSIEVYRLDLFEEDSLFGRKSLKKNEEATKARNKIEENILGQNEKVENEEETKKPEKKFKAKKIEAKNETKLVKNRKEAHKPQEKIEESEKEIQSEIVPSLYDLKTRFKTEKKFLNPNPNFSNQLEEDGENKSFGEGGVPELQVGCEGVEESFRDKRDASNGEDHEDTNIPLQPANIVDVHLIFQSEEDEDPQGVFYEDRDELLKLRKLEKELQNPSPPRGDIPIDLHEEYHKKEKLPVRGDLASTFLNGDSPDPNEDTYSYNGRKLLSISEISPLKRRKRELGGWDGVMWGYGEDEGILPDDELQTDEKRRDEEKRRVEAVRRREERRREEERRNHHRVSGDKREEDERIRKEHERRFEERERENKRREERIKLEEERRKSHEGRNEHNLEAERRRHGEKRRMQDEQRRMSDHRRNWPMDDQRLQEHRRREEEEKRKPEDERRRSDDERRRQENERRSDEHRRREDEHRGREDEHRRREDNREPEEIRRPEERRPEDERRHEEERRRHLERRRHEEERRRREEQRRREEVERRRTQNENLTPSNFMRPDRRQEEENEKKLKDYIQRNTPIVVSSRRHSGDSRAREAEDRRRNRPENLTRSRHPYENRHHHREPVWLEQKRAMESTREYNISGLKTPENERRHGPSPPSDVWRRSGMDDIRRRADVRRMEEEGRRLDRKRIDKEQEERRRDDRMKMELEGKRLEEEDLRRKSLMYEEERKWHERMRQQAERMRQEWMHESNRRSQSDRKPVWSRYQPFQSNNNEKGYQYPSPPDNLNNKGYQPPPDLNNKGYQPPPDLNNKGYQPPSDMNNKGYQPPPDMNNKGYQPPPDENNKGYQPPVDLNNKGYQPSRVNPEFERDRQRLDQERRRMEAERLARNRGPDDR